MTFSFVSFHKSHDGCTMDAKSEKFHGNSPWTVSLLVTAAMLSHSSCLLAAVTLIRTLTSLAQFSSWSSCHESDLSSAPQLLSAQPPSVCRPGRSLWTLHSTAAAQNLLQCPAATQLLQLGKSTNSE